MKCLKCDMEALTASAYCIKHNILSKTISRIQTPARSPTASPLPFKYSIEKSQSVNYTTPKPEPQLKSLGKIVAMKSKSIPLPESSLDSKIINIVKQKSRQEYIKDRTLIVKTSTFREDIITTYKDIIDEYYLKTKEYIEVGEIIIHKSFCLDSPLFSNIFTVIDSHGLKKGGFGTILECVFNRKNKNIKQILEANYFDKIDVPVVIKKMSDDKKSTKDMKRQVKTFIAESEIMGGMSNIIIDGKNPHFLFYYCTCMCEADNQYFHILEKADDDMTNLPSFVRKNKSQCYILLFQLLSALHTFQSTEAGVHNDIKQPNILFSNDVYTGKYYEYSIMGKKYYVPCCEYTMLLADYSVSSIVHCSSPPVRHPILNIDGNYINKKTIEEVKQHYNNVYYIEYIMDILDIFALFTDSYACTQGDVNKQFNIGINSFNKEFVKEITEIRNQFPLTSEEIYKYKKANKNCDIFNVISDDEGIIYPSFHKFINTGIMIDELFGHFKVKPYDIPIQTYVLDPVSEVYK